MKSILINVFLLLIAVTLGLSYLGFRGQSGSVAEYEIGGRSYRLLTAKTPAEWEKGLMGIKQLNDADGMLFIFPDKAYRTFWNKNTMLDLDVIWLDGEKVIGWSSLPSILKSSNIVIINSPGKVDKVAEIIKKY